MARSIFCFLAAWAALLAPSAAAAEVQLHFSALQRMLASQAFTQDGRRYLKGTPSSRCSFAYLEKPRVGAALGKLKIDARFSGRSALNLVGQCVGLGDSFDLTILATPYYRNGAVAFREVQVISEGKDTFYKRRVRRGLMATLEKDFSYPLAEEARKLLEKTRVSPDYRQDLSDFRVSSIRIVDGAVVLTVDFRLAVK